MKRIPRYVVAELLQVLLLTLAGMTLFMLLVGAAREGVRQGLGLGPILRLVPYILPEALRFSVPATMLLSVCSVFGRMSADNEVVALKSLGITPQVIVVPALVMAFLVSLIAVWLNDLAVSWGRQGVQRVVIESVEQIAYGMLRTQRSYVTRRFSITVQRVEGQTLVRPTVTFQGSAEDPPVTLTAAEAQLRRNPQDNTLSIFLTDGTIDVGDKLSLAFPDTIERAIPLADASRQGDGSSSPSQIALRRIAAEVARQRQRVAALERSLATRAAYQLLTGDFRQLSDPDWHAREADLVDARGRLCRLEAEPWRRWANGFSCFFFVVLGAPLAIQMRSANLFTSFAACFLPILLVYYPLLAYGVDRAKEGALHPSVVWLGNAILLAGGLWMLRRVVRF